MTNQKITDMQLINEWEKQLTQKDMANNLRVTVITIHKRMKKLGLPPWHPHDVEETKNRGLRIYYAVSGHPGTTKDVLQRTGIRNYYLFSYSIKKLRNQNKILSVKISIVGSGRSAVYNAHESVDGLAGMIVHYCPGDENLLGSYITGYLPIEIPMGLRKSLKHRLNYLPKKALEVVNHYIDGHTV